MEKILYLTTVLFNNPKTGGEIATQNFVENLNEQGYEIDLVGYQRKNDAELLNSHGINHFPIEERIIEAVPKNYVFWKWLAQSFLSDSCYSVQKFKSPKYQSKVFQLLTNNKYKLIIIEHSQLLWILSDIKRILNDTPVILNSQNVEWQVYEDLVTAANHWLKRFIYKRESRLMKKLELSSLEKLNGLWVLSENDKSLYLGGLDNVIDCQVMPIVGSKLVKNKTNINQKTKYDIVILGTWTWQPNMEGLKWFIEKVYPLIKDKGLKIAIAGKGAANYLNNLNSEIEYLGFVESAENFLFQGRKIAIPTTEGGGIQIKTLDAISTGKPIVTTSVGVRGISELPNSVSICDNVSDFAMYLTSASDESLTCSDWIIKRKDNFQRKIKCSISEVTSENY